MRRVRRSHPQNGPGFRRWWLAGLAVVALLFAPVLVSPAHAHGHASRSGCGMEASSHAGRHGHGACNAACAVCSQVAPAREEPPPEPPAVASAAVTYPAVQLPLAGVEPERGTPPPR